MVNEGMQKLSGVVAYLVMKRPGSVVGEEKMTEKNQTPPRKNGGPGRDEGNRKSRNILPRETCHLLGKNKNRGREKQNIAHQRDEQTPT